jgi:hypothetical protein
MSPLQIAAGSALLMTVVASFVPADRASDTSARGWLPSHWRRYRIKLLVLQVVATAVLAAGANQIGWAPEGTASAFTAIAHGVGWSVAAVALLRAEFPGLNQASPGFSVLKSISEHLSDDLTDRIAEEVRNAVPIAVDEMMKCAFICKSRANPPRPDGTLTPDAKAIAANIELLAEENGLTDLRELIVDIVSRHKLPRCW